MNVYKTYIDLFTFILRSLFKGMYFVILEEIVALGFRY